MFFAHKTVGYTFQTAMAALKQYHEQIVQHNVRNKQEADLDLKRAMSQLFPIGSQANGAIAFLEGWMKDNPALTTEAGKARSLIGAFRNDMSQALEFQQQTQAKRAEEKSPKQLKDDLGLYAKNDDHKNLKVYLSRYSHVSKLSELDYALRVAADYNSINVINILVKTGANIMSPGPESGQIALHRAIAKGHSQAVDCLLKHPDSMDYFDPVGQLLYKNKDSKTPLDLLKEVVDPSLQNKMIASIEVALARSVHPATTKDQIILINETIETLRHSQAHPAQMF